MGQIVNGMTSKPRENYKALKAACLKIKKLNYGVYSVWMDDRNLGKALCANNKNNGIIQVCSNGTLDTFNTLNAIVVFLIENKDKLFSIVQTAPRDWKKLTNKDYQKLLFLLSKMIEKCECHIEMSGLESVNAVKSGKIKQLSLATVTGYPVAQAKSAISLDTCINKRVKYDEEVSLHIALVALIKEAPALQQILSSVVDSLSGKASSELDRLFATEYQFYGKEQIPLLTRYPDETPNDRPLRRQDASSNTKGNATVDVQENRGKAQKQPLVSKVDTGKKPAASNSTQSGVKIIERPNPLPPISVGDSDGKLKAEPKKSNECCKQRASETRDMNNRIATLTKKNEVLVQERLDAEKTMQEERANYQAEQEKLLDQAEKTKTYYEGELERLQIQLCNKEDEFQKGNKIQKDLTDRLAAEMNIKISANESSLENISIKCRPMKIAEDYNMFVSGPWLDAKQVLDDKQIPEEDAAMFLCSIIKISSKEAQAMFEERILSPLTTLQKNVRHPLRNQQPKDGPITKDNPLSSLDSIIGDQLRRDAEIVDIKPLCEEIVKAIGKEFEKYEKTLKLKTILASKAVQHYMETSARLAWKMAIQRPAMTYKTPDVGKDFRGENVHPLAWGSQPMEAKTPGNIKYYQYPTLLHGEKVMVLGKVFVA